MAIVESILDGVDTFLAWLSTSLKQTTESYCELQTADSSETLVAHDGSLMSIVRVRGVKALVGSEEFNRIQEGLMQSLQATMSRQGHAIQVHFAYNKDEVGEEIANILQPAKETAERLSLKLGDVFEERVKYLSDYCAHEEVYLALWTLPVSLTKEQSKRGFKDKQKMIKKEKIPPFQNSQNLVAAIPDLRESHDSFVRAVNADLNMLGILSSVLEVHDALYQVRRTVDPNFTDRSWRPLLPGDKIPAIREVKRPQGDISDVLWPPLGRQLLPRDAENLNLRTARIGDRIYSTIFIDLFPKEVQHFIELFKRTLQTRVPWRMSFLIEGGGLSALKYKTALTSILSFSSSQNRLINDSKALLDYVNLTSDDAVVKLRVSVATWAPEGETRLLRSRVAQLAKAIEGWGSCDVSEISGDAFAGVVSSMLGVSSRSIATASIAPLPLKPPAFNSS